MKSNPEYDYVDARADSTPINEPTRSIEFAYRYMRVLAVMCVVLLILGIAVSVVAIVYNHTI